MKPLSNFMPVQTGNDFINYLNKVTLTLEWNDWALISENSLETLKQDDDCNKGVHLIEKLGLKNNSSRFTSDLNFKPQSYNRVV